MRQAIDTIWFVELTIILTDVIPGGAWALLVLPIVIASLRVSSRSVLLVWAFASGLYVLPIRMRLVEVADSAASWSVLLQQVGVLLIVAACVALLARWLQEGWIAQAELTDEAATRLDQIRAVERAARAMRELEIEEILKVAPGHVTALGFDAGSVSRGPNVIVAGDRSFVPANSVIDVPDSGVVEVTRWSNPVGATVWSASVVEELSTSVITGWAGQEVTEARAEALADLVANLTTALRSAKYLATVRYDATHDPLTGLKNRAELFRNLEAAASDHQPAAVLFVDLDHFKAVNDVYGHRVGDHLLVLIARRLDKVVKGDGTVGRYGGDEFVVVLSGIPALNARDLALELLTAIQTPFEVDGHTIEATFSVGVAQSDRVTSSGALLAAADAAAYDAKADGRNTARITQLNQQQALTTDNSFTDRYS